MNDRGLRMRAAVLARFSEPLSFFYRAGTWSGVALVCALLTGCAGGTPPPRTADQTAPSKADSAGSKSAAAESQPGWGPSDPALLQRRRQAIAQLLETSIAYRTILDVSLTDAKLAGPYVHVSRNRFSGSTSEFRFYCAKANLDLPYWPLPYPRTAIILVNQAKDGSEKLGATIGLSKDPSECTGSDVNYNPFPELEQLRAQRRAALGKSI